MYLGLKRSCDVGVAGVEATNDDEDCSVTSVTQSHAINKARVSNHCIIMDSVDDKICGYKLLIGKFLQTKSKITLWEYC